jgi:hypothetical protein
MKKNHLLKLTGIFAMLLTFALTAYGQSSGLLG